MEGGGGGKGREVSCFEKIHEIKVTEFVGYINLIL